MPAYYVSSPDRQRNSFLADEGGCQAIMRRAAARHPDAQYSFQSVEDIWLDLGGAVHMNDTKVFFEAAGVPFGIYARQIPYFRPMLAELPELVEKFPGCIGFTGSAGAYLFALATRDELVRVLDGLEEKFRADIIKDEERRAELFSSHPNLTHVSGFCPCGSGKTILECCRPRP